MDKKQGRAFLSLLAVDSFLDNCAHELPRATSTGIRDRFRLALNNLLLQIQMQSGAPLLAQSLTAAKDAKRAALLRDHMAPIVRIARIEAASNTALSALRMPRGDPGVQKLLAHAAGMVAVVADHQESFIRAGMPADFIDRFEAAIDDIVATLTARSHQHGRRGGATAGIRAALVECTRCRDVLDAFIKSEVHDQPVLLANWALVKRVHRLPSRRKPTAIVTPDRRELPAPGALPIRDASRLLSPVRMIP